MNRMSGEIFHPPDSLEELDVSKWNPLTCYLCNEKYEEPCILGCFHSFCSRCLRGRSSEGKMVCPLCGLSTQIKDGEEMPPSDRLMTFLVESSGNEKEKCANCDVEQERMYFCNTCVQPLCEACREETHKAKMFAKHDIVVLSKRTKEIHRECAIHQEPYILFSTERKTMLCINCFRDMKVESRSYCVDLESAYNQGCKKLDQSMMAIKDLQSSVRDAILLLKVLLEEIQQNAEKEKTAVTDLYDHLLEEITATKTALLQEVDSQYESKEKSFKAELVALSTLLPTLHTHLVTSAAFCSSANRFEFLDLAYILMERLKSIIQLQHPLHPSQGSQIITDFKSMFAKCLEPLLFPPKPSSPAINNSSYISLTPPPITLSSASYITQRPFSISTPGSTSPINGAQRRQTGYNSLKYKLIESKGVFAEHCSEFDTSHKELNSETEQLKVQTQELQRDLTVRRCLAKVAVVSNLDQKIGVLQEKLQEHYTTNEQKHMALEKHWEEAVQRIGTEQELYQSQIHDIIRLKQESEQLKTILSRMKSFVVSIASVTERIAPKLGKTTKDSEHDTQMADIFTQINTMTPDSQHRVDAIRTAQEERETAAANRQNPLDEELIKTKGMLKAPSARTPRKDSGKRNSREITSDVHNAEVASPEKTKDSAKDSCKRNSMEITNDTHFMPVNAEKSKEVSRNDSLKRISREIDSEASADLADVEKSKDVSRKDSFKRMSKEKDNAESANAEKSKDVSRKDSFKRLSRELDNNESANRDKIKDVSRKDLPKRGSKIITSETQIESANTEKTQDIAIKTESSTDSLNIDVLLEHYSVMQKDLSDEDDSLLLSNDLSPKGSNSYIFDGDLLLKVETSSKSKESSYNQNTSISPISDLSPKIGKVKVTNPIDSETVKSVSVNHRSPKTLNGKVHDFTDSETIKLPQRSPGKTEKEKVTDFDSKTVKCSLDKKQSSTAVKGKDKAENVPDLVELDKSPSSKNGSECEEREVNGEDGGLPLPVKDFVASTVKGFESQHLQTTPEKGDKPVTKTRRSRKSSSSS